VGKWRRRVSNPRNISAAGSLFVQATADWFCLQRGGRSRFDRSLDSLESLVPHSLAYPGEERRKQLERPNRIGIGSERQTSRSICGLEFERRVRSHRPDASVPLDFPVPLDGRKPRDRLSRSSQDLLPDAHCGPGLCWTVRGLDDRLDIGIRAQKVLIEVEEKLEDLFDGSDDRDYGLDPGY
jgi:hypothetical protein